VSGNPSARAAAAATSARCGVEEISEDKVLAHIAEATRLFVRGGHLEAAVRAAKVALPAWERRRAFGDLARAHTVGLWLVRVSLEGRRPQQHARSFRPTNWSTHAQVRIQLTHSWEGAWFQPSNLSGEKLVSKFAFSNSNSTYRYTTGIAGVYRSLHQLPPAGAAGAGSFGILPPPPGPPPPPATYYRVRLVGLAWGGEAAGRTWVHREPTDRTLGDMLRRLQRWGPCTT
jgi:hypothetical protein